MFTRKSIPYGVLTGVLASSLLLSGCSKKTPAQQVGPVEVATVTVQPEHVALTTELPGRTSAYLVAEIRPQVNGLIQRRAFAEGTNVKAGDLLFQIDPAPYKAAYEQARSAVVSAEAELATAKANIPAMRLRAERLKGLADIHAVGQQDYDDAIAALQQAEATVEARKAAVEVRRAALEAARINLAYTPIRSPISGRIGIPNATVGAMVTAYQPTALAVVQQLNPIYVDVAQNSGELLRLRDRLESGRLARNGSQNKVQVVLENGTTVEGTLKARDLTVDPATGTVTLRIVVPNPSQLLLPGMFVRAVVQEGVNEQGLLVPQQGVTRNAKGIPIAMVVTKDDKVEMRTLELDRAIGDRWLVTKGLNAGDRLIVEGLQRVRPGDLVRVAPAGVQPQQAPTTAAAPKGEGRV